MSRNRLDQETSPYLLQHKQNPVHWHPWGDAALQAARERNVPILLSIGYAACHWCHVMAHESFEDPETAAVMNANFVNIKVDREERPDLDGIYQTALALMGEHGGWPLTMFLTPEGEPFYGGTYFPAETAFGRPAFRDLLNGVARIYREEHDKVVDNAAALRAGIARMAASGAEGEIQPEFLEQVARGLFRVVDRKYGGIGKAPKFPQIPAFEFLWRAHKRSVGVPYGGAVTRTLGHLCQGGIYDHLGGGFARYSTDKEWLVPHFEKMLYDNAQLVEFLTLVWQETRDPFFATAVEETIAWVFREMRHEAGGFLSSLDADSEGGEGAFYVWTEAEIDRLLDTDAGPFKAAYDVRPEGNWEGKTILRRNVGGALPEWNADFEAKLRSARAILFEARATRPRPATDDKVLADWNGLMIAALAFAGGVFEKPEWEAAARKAFRFLCKSMTAEDGRLRHSWCRGTLRHPATLDDYAQMARAALALYETTQEQAYLDQAETWVAIVNARYWDDEGGGYFLTADDLTDVIARMKPASDNAAPSGNGTMAGVLARLFYLTGKADHRDRAERTIRAFAGEANHNPVGLAALLNAFELLNGAIQVTILGDREAEETRALLRVVHRVSLPNRVLLVVTDGAALPPGHPASGKERVDGRSTCYICRGPVCDSPITDAAALEAALRQTG
ncbi:MAG: thioredoxin domain-containing protein [Alphaproteobacteria bacterium]|nr:thioredoxin domain-containing protein [Alphaproteobacteria bacterium]